jgi:hypothetical protein
MNKADCNRSKRVLEQMLNAANVVYSNPASGAYRIGDIVYFYKKRGYQKGDNWFLFNSHREFLNSL